MPIDLPMIQPPAIISRVSQERSVGRSIIPGIMPSLIMAAPADPIDIQHVYSGQSAPFAASKTFSGASLGDPASSRRIAVCIGTQDEPAFTSVTVAGQATTVRSNNSQGYNRIIVADLLLPSGTTGDIVVTWANPVAVVFVDVFRITGLATAPVTQEYIISGIGGPSPATWNITDTKVMFSMSYAYNSSVAVGNCSWLGATEVSDRPAATLVTNHKGSAAYNPPGSGSLSVRSSWASFTTWATTNTIYNN